MPVPTSVFRICAALAAGSVIAGVLGGCGPSDQPARPASPPPPPDAGFRGADCNGVTDADVNKAVGRSLFVKAAVSDAGCFWQENTVIGTFGVGMGISTWWYRGSDMDTERGLEQKAGRTLTELSIDGKKGFKAYDANACSIYVAKGGDVITWSIQTMNPAMLGNLCSITEQLAQLSQQRVN
jgi:hypothetical protein